MAKFDSHSIGIAAGIFSAACFGLTGALVNRLADSVPAPEITFVRGLVGVICISIFVRSQLPSLFQRGASIIWIRAIAGAISILCFSWNLQLADVGTANILFNLSLIFVLIVDYASGRSQISSKIVGSVMLAVAGIGLYWYGSKLIISGEILTIGLIGATAATVAYTALNKASKTYSSWLIVWAVSLMSIPISLLAKTGSWAVPSASGMVMLAGIASSVLAAHYLLNVSFAKLSLPLATALGPSCIIWSVLGVAVFQGVMPTMHAVMGIIVYSAAMGLMIADGKKRSEPAQVNIPRTRA